MNSNSNSKINGGDGKKSEGEESSKVLGRDEVAELSCSEAPAAQPRRIHAKKVAMRSVGDID